MERSFKVWRLPKAVTTLLLATVTIGFAAHAQNYEKIIIDTADKLYGNYLVVKPQSNNIQGVMVLIPGFGSPAESILPETKLHNVAYVNDILTIIINTGEKLYIDKSANDGLNKVFADVVKRYGVDKSQFVIGGHSAGGTLSLRYAELCTQYPSQYPIQPKGVFSVDGPADLVDMYHYFEREIKRNFSQAGMSEAVYVKRLMDKELGPLKDNLQKYAALSPFVALQDTVGNEKYLYNLAVRVYHDVDIVWMLQNRRRGVYDMNVAASADLISQLLQQGNNRAEFVPGLTGYRPDGSRHPHSWTIIEENNLVQWVKKTLEFFPQYAPEPYNLPAQRWNTEKAKFPLAFAPSIPYKGVDDIRFMPGFYNAAAPDFWSYCFLWYLDGDTRFTEKQLQDNLTAYYDGLTQAPNVTNVTVKKITPANGYEVTFECVVNTVDKFVTQKLVKLNLTVNIKKCPQANKTIAFFTISPQPFSHAVWQQLNAVRDGVGCAK